MPTTLTDELVTALIRLLVADAHHVCRDKYDCPYCQAAEGARRALKRANKEGRHE